MKKKNIFKGWPLCGLWKTDERATNCSKVIQPRLDDSPTTTMVCKLDLIKYKSGVEFVKCFTPARFPNLSRLPKKMTMEDVLLLCLVHLQGSFSRKFLNVSPRLKKFIPHNVISVNFWAPPHSFVQLQTFLFIVNFIG